MYYLIKIKWFLIQIDIVYEDVIFCWVILIFFYISGNQIFAEEKINTSLV